MGWRGMYSFELTQGLEACSYERGNQSARFREGGECLDWLSDCQLLKNNSVLWSLIQGLTSHNVQSGFKCSKISPDRVTSCTKLRA